MRKGEKAFGVGMFWGMCYGKAFYLAVGVFWLINHQFKGGLLCLIDQVFVM
jgi:hypothetical protein